MFTLKRIARFALFALVIGAALRDARAQGLADAARQAGEQRKAAEGQPRIKIVAVPEHTLPTVALSTPDVEHYTHLRMAMAQPWHRDLRLYERMRGGVQTARSLDELLKVLDAEAEIQKLFQVYNYNSEGFQLSNDVFQQYAQARESIGREFYRDVNMYNRVEDGMRKVTRQREAYKVYEAEPKLKEAFEFNGLSATSFMDVFLTISRAQERGSTSYGSKRPASMTPLQSANTVFVTQHASDLSGHETQLSKKRAWQFVRPPLFRIPY